MPHLRFRGVSVSDLKTISTSLLDMLETLFESPRDWFTLEHQSGTFVFDGEVTQGETIVEVLSFDRGADAKKQTAVLLTELLKPYAVDGEVAVIFYDLERQNYFDNGESYD